MSSPFAPRPFGGTIESNPISDYERQLGPIYRQEVREEEEKRNRTRPLQWIFDRLQTGQYLSANITRSIIEGIQGVPDEDRLKIGEAIRGAITGEIRGSYSDVLRDTLKLGRTELFQGEGWFNKEGTRRSQWDWADVLGFIGDVMLDPLTYTGFGGASKAARKAAGEFADDSVRIFLRRLAANPDELVKLTDGKVTQSAIENAIQKGTRESVEKLGSHMNMILGRVHKEAMQAGLQKTAPDLMQQTARALEDVGQEGYEHLAKNTNILSRLEHGTAYAGAGTSPRIRFMRYEPKKILGIQNMRQQPGFGRRSWNKLMNLFKAKDPIKGNKFMNAVWAKLHEGPVGELRRLIGFTDPYQKYLRAKEMSTLHAGKVLTVDEVAQVDEILEGVDLDELLALAAREEDLASIGKLSGPKVDIPLDPDEVGADVASASKEFMERRASRTSDINMRAPDAAERRVGTTLDAVSEKTREAFVRLRGLLDRWGSEEARENVLMGLQEVALRERYLPGVHRYHQRAMAPKKAKTRTFIESREKEIDLMKWLYDVDATTAAEMVDNNVSGLVTDLREMLIERAIVHSRVMTHSNMIKQFKEFGVNLRAAAGDPLAAALDSVGKEFKSLGMKTIDHTALSGYVFDSDVADVFQRALDMTGKDRNIIARFFQKYTTWWKGIVTMTSGFHARNFMSNQVTMFLKHGPRMFKKKEAMYSLAATIYAVGKTDDNVRKIASAMGFDEKWLQKYSSHRIGNLSVGELAEYGRRSGVISESTHGFSDGGDVLQKRATAGKVTVERGPVRDISRSIGSVLENHARMQSFMLDYADNATDVTMLKEGFDIWDIDAPALDYAKNEAKKWFIDYDDLTDFEKTWMKNIIPFYTWIRKNLANQISGVLLYPEMYALIPKIEDALSYDDPDYDPTYIPEWMREEGMFPVGRGEDGAFKMFRPDFAYGDLNLIPLQWNEGDMLPHLDLKDTKDTIVNAIHPSIKWAVSQFIDGGYNFFYREELGEDSPAPYALSLFSQLPGTMAFMDGLLRTAGYENGLDMQMDENGKFRANARVVEAIETFLPVVRQLEYVMYLPQAVPGIQEWMEEVSGVSPKYEDLEMNLQLLSFFLGIKFKPQDVEAEKARVRRDIYWRSRGMLDETRPRDMERSLRARQQINQQIRRLGG